MLHIILFYLGVYIVFSRETLLQFMGELRQEALPATSIDTFSKLLIHLSTVESRERLG